MDLKVKILLVSFLFENKEYRFVTLGFLITDYKRADATV